METYSTDTSEKITMETDGHVFNYVLNWAIDRIDSTDNYEDALALASEFGEWISSEDGEEVDYLCIEDNQWGDQEIDVTP